MKKIYALFFSASALLLQAQTPTASFVVSQTVVCPNAVIQTTNLSTGATSYSYVLDGTTTLTSANPAISFSTDGNHAIDLYAVNNGTVSSPFSIGITVNPIPVVTTGSAGTVSLAPPNGSTNGWSPWVWTFADPVPAGGIVSGLTMTFSGVDQGWGGSGAAAQFYLGGKYIGGAVLSHTSQNFTLTIAAPFPSYTYGGSNNLEMYFVGWSGWQAFYNSGAITLNYQTNAPALQICGGTAITLSGVGANSYTWSPSAVNGQTFIPTSSAVYTVSGSNAFGCIGTATRQVSVSSPTITAQSGAICPGQTFAIVPSGAVSYTVTGGQYTVSPQTSTTYSVNGTDANGCVSLIPSVVNLTVVPFPTVTVNSASVCQGSTYTLTPSGAASYSFQNNTAVHTITSSANYTVLGYNSLGCPALVPAMASVTMVPLPSVSLMAAMLCKGSTYSLNASGAQSYTYSSGSPIITPSATANYTVIGANAFGCTNMAIASIIVDNCSGIEEIHTIKTLQLQPNPSKGSVIIISSETAQWQVIDMQGRIISSLKIVEGSQQLDLNLAAGLYYLRQANSAETVKLLITQ